MNQKQFNLDELSMDLHSHVPYVVILLQAAQKWKDQHDGTMPQSFKEKDQFKEMLKSMAKDYGQEVNFHEAVKKAFLLYQDSTPPENI